MVSSGQQASLDTHNHWPLSPAQPKAGDLNHHQSGTPALTLPSQ
jgi:hypothetical protein